MHMVSLPSKDTKGQIEELQKYNIGTYITSKKKDSDNLIKNIKESILEKKFPVCFFDESDYGTGVNQTLNNNAWLEIDNFLQEKKCAIVLLSATQEECIFSSWSNDPESIHIFYDPEDKKYADYAGQKYHGPKWYLEHKRYKEAEKFLDFEENKVVFSKQGQELLENLEKSQKIFGVLRLQSDFLKCKTKNPNNGPLAKAIKQINPNIKVIFADAKDSFVWDNDSSANWKAELYTKEKENSSHRVLIVICQTCTRSTEVCFRKDIEFWHDYRETTTNYNTLLQAIGRVFFRDYKDRVSPEDYPMLYTSHAEETLNLAAGNISVEEYKELTDRSLSNRISTSKLSNFEDLLFFYPTDKWLDTFTIRNKETSLIAKKAIGLYGDINVLWPENDPKNLGLRIINPFNRKRDDDDFESNLLFSYLYGGARQQGAIRLCPVEVFKDWENEFNLILHTIVSEISIFKQYIFLEEDGLFKNRETGEMGELFFLMFKLEDKVKTKTKSNSMYG